MNLLTLLKVEITINLDYIGEGLGQIAKAVGYQVFNSKLSGLLDSLMKDENYEVRWDRIGTTPHDLEQGDILKRAQEKRMIEDTKANEFS